MQKHRLLFLLLVLSHFISAQESDKTLTFKVSNPTMKITVPGSDTLWAEFNNLVKIRVKGKNKIASVKLVGGTIEGKDSIYSARVIKGERAVLNVFERQPEGKPRLCFTKNFIVKKIPDPVVYVCGIKEDSTADKLDLIYSNQIKARSWVYNQNLKVISFLMICASNGNVDSLYAEGSKLTDNMRQYIHRLQSGAVLYFDHIRYEVPTGEIREIKPIAIYVDETNKYKVGYRKVGN